jgi:hypothetical protein
MAPMSYLRTFSARSGFSASRPASFLAALLVVTSASACSRRAEPVAPSPAPIVAPPAPAAPPPAEAPAIASDAGTAPTTTPAAAAAAEPELPPAVLACNRKCSVEANHRQMEGFVRCERAKKGPGCKSEVLTANDTERAACRKACDAKRAH